MRINKNNINDHPIKRIGGSQSVYRAIAVLKTVVRHNKTGITALPLAEEIGLTLATAHRLLQVLVGECMLTVDPYSKKYHVGLELFQMGNTAHEYNVSQQLEGHLMRLRDLTGETVFLFVRSGTDALCLRRIDGDFPIRALTLTDGSRRPLGIGAGGLALLAAQPESLIKRILNSNKTLFGNYFKTTLDEMLDLISKTQAAGFALNDGRLQGCVKAIGMAFGAEEKLATIAVSIATSDTSMTPKRQEFFRTVMYNQFKYMDWSLLS